MRVTVVGAGVVGLTTALRLAEDRHRVSVISADRPESTTSSVAAAVWYPYRAEPRERVGAWGARSVEVFTTLAARGVGGIGLARCVEVVSAGAATPWFQAAVTDLAPAGPDELPPGHARGWMFTTPVIDMRRYLPWLAAEVRRAGATLTFRRLASLAEAAGDADVVVHCAGLGARELAGDPTVVPVRGQVVVVADPGLDRVLLDESGPTYVVPRGDDCVLGGTAEEGVWSTAPDEAAAASILARCVALEPRLADAPVLAHRAGLRPVRPSVRLELDSAGAGGVPVVHHYGHGGAGVTLSWGCADEASALVRTAARS